MTKKIIITADDYGMSPRFNQGVLELATLGIITGVSVMIKRKYVRTQELLKTGVAIGLHLELAGKTTSREIHSQIMRFKKRFGKLPTHLDGHQHQHLTRDNLPLVAHVAKKFHLPVRSRFANDRAYLRQYGIATSDDFVSWHPNRIKRLKERLGKTTGPVTELVCHPGYHDLGCICPYNRERFLELLFLKSTAFARLIQGFELISYETHSFFRMRSLHSRR